MLIINVNVKIKKSNVCLPYESIPTAVMFIANKKEFYMINSDSQNEINL